jgi:endonuclease I
MHLQRHRRPIDPPRARPRRAAFCVALACALVAASVAPAAPPPDYYQTVTIQTGEDLKLELRKIIAATLASPLPYRNYPVSSISYAAARDALLQSVDNIGSGNIRTVYLSDIRPTSAWNVTINREHTWPQSYGTGNSPKVSDMHHLFLCDSVINSTRGNRLYGDVDMMSSFDTYMSADMSPGNTNFAQGDVWQVSDNRKGDVARAILYMDTRYPELTLINRGQTPGANQMGYLDELLVWNADDPPDALEQQRNDRVFPFQNNRNPYIDNPAWVPLVYGGPVGASDPVLSNLNHVPAVPDNTQSVTVSVNATDPDGVASVNMFWRVGTSGAYTTVSMAGGPLYTASMTIPAQPGGTLVQFYVEATDTLANVADAPPAGAAGPDSYVVVGDDPTLTNLQTNPASPSDSAGVDIFANATDDDGNSAANLTLSAHWRLQSVGGAFATIPMSISTGTTWQTNSMVPAQAVGEVVEYYVMASDAGSGSATIPPAGPAGPAEYTVEESLPFETITSVGQVLGKILITEIIHRTDSDAFAEYIEIVNNSTQGFIVDTLSFTDNNHTSDTVESFCTFPVGSTLPPGGIAVVFVRADPTQVYVDSIPVLSSDGRAVQVFALDDGVVGPSLLTFNGTAVPEMIPGDAAGIQLATAGDNVALFFGAAEPYLPASVIDGAGYNSPSGPDDTVWGPTVITSGAANNVPSATDGIARTSIADTDTRFDWEPVLPPAMVGTHYTPGEVPFTVVPVELSAFGLE